MKNFITLTVLLALLGATLFFQNALNELSLTDDKNATETPSFVATTTVNVSVPPPAATSSPTRSPLPALKKDTIAKQFSPPKSIEVKPIVKEIKKEPSLPPPLKAPEVATSSPQEIVLTKDGIIQWTNFHRHESNLSSLVENDQLNAAASLKLKDMFDNQYFAHVAPNGFDAAHFVELTTYEFLAVGENLAFGKFPTDKDLVLAWMESAGHRANILGNYREIGVAAGRGKIADPDSGIVIDTWLAVQIFALPVSACPSTDPELRRDIEFSQRAVDDLIENIKALRAEIDASNQKTEEEYKIYEQKVNEHNANVNLANRLIDELKQKVASYNSQVTVYNQCLTGIK